MSRWTWQEIARALEELPIPMPENTKMGIGIVGAGTIIRVAHLPAYRKAGFNVRGIVDRDPARSSKLAQDFGLPRAYGSLDELLSDPTVLIVDIGIPPDQQPEVGKAVANAGKHLLCHKPLAWTLAEAKELVDAAKAAGVLLAVNQQTRWAPALQAAKKVLDEGFLGTPTRCLFDFAFQEDSPWWNASSEPTLRADCVHTIDAVRFLLGEPSQIVAHMWSEEGQKAAGLTLVEVILEYGPSTAARISSSAVHWLPEIRADFELQGTGGIVRASLAEWTHYPLEMPDQFELALREDPSVRYTPRFKTSHIPDAFRATMAQLMIAIENDQEPSISGQDNLVTMALIDAASRAAKSGQAVAISA